MAAAGTGGGAGRVEQDGVELLLGLPFQHIGADDIGAQPDPLHIGAQHLQAPFVRIERGDGPACSGELHALATGRGA